MSQRIELRAVIASKQGLSCLGYYTLANRTKHLRERLYVSVRDGDKLFLPRRREHFPVEEIEAYYLDQRGLAVDKSIGGGGGEVVFSCEGPAADEGASAIAATLAGLDAGLNQGSVARWRMMLPEKFSYRLAAHHDSGPPYRPPTLPTRYLAPASFTPEARQARTLEAQVERGKREKLKEWGVLEAYDDMQAEQKTRQARSAPHGMPGLGASQSFNNAPWKETPWK